MRFFAAPPFFGYKHKIAHLLTVAVIKVDPIRNVSVENFVTVGGKRSLGSYYFLFEIERDDLWRPPNKR